MNRVIESLERRTLFNGLLFSKPGLFAAGTNPSQVVATDLNHDGKVDVVVSDFGSASVAVLMGNGDGTFQPAVFYAAGVHPSGVAVGDLTGSGNDDIVVTNEASNSISVLMGSGDGTFAPQVTYPVGGRPQWVVLADVNHDGKLDIITADHDTNSISVLLNAGDGTFNPAAQYFAGYQPSSVGVADFNGDGFPDVVVTNPGTNDIHILKNNGLGQFSMLGAYLTGPSPRSLAIADLNSDTRPDVITADLDSAAISILGGNGNGTLRAVINHLAGLRPEAVITADLNGDQHPDIITADVYRNGVAVVLRSGIGSISQPKQFLAGDGPVAVAAADVNGDGKLDLITADFNSGQIAVMLNRTVFTPLAATTAVMTPSQNPVETKNRLVLDVQVSKPTPSVRRPTGVVQFFINGGIYAIKLVSKTGLARLIIPNIGPGTYTITAHYGGDTFFSQSDTAPLTQVVVGPDLATPFVTPVIKAVHLPNTYVPGTHGVVDVGIYAQGAGPAVGTVQVHLFASTSTSFDDAVFPVQTTTNTLVSLRLLGNQTRIVPIGFQLPANIDSGNYTIFAVLTPVSGLNAAQVSTVPAVGLTTQQAVLQFGRVSTQQNFRLTRRLPRGDVYTLQLTGPGTGNVIENADGGISIAMTGTASNSVLHIISSTGVILDGLTQNNIMAAVVAPTTNLAGKIDLEYGIHKITLNDANNSSLVLGGGIPNVLTFHNLSNVNLFSGVPIDTLNVNTYTNLPNDTITTPWIHAIHSTGDFGANLLINAGVGGRNLGLSTATIGGSLGNAVWRIASNVGSIKVGGVSTGWSGSIRGTINSFVDTGDFAGQLAAHHIGLLQINGNVTNADVLTGADFGSDARFGNGDDTFASGTLNKLTIGGNIINSVFAAGLKPAGDVILGPGATLLRASGIGPVTIGGTLDSNTRFLAFSLPKSVKIDSVQIATSSNADFVS